MLNKNTNILIINDFSFIDGGASKVAIESAIELKRRGFNVIFFSAVNPIMNELIKSNVKIVSTNQYDILKNPNRISASYQGLWNKKATNKLNEITKSLDSENTIVHVHSWEKALSSSVIRQAIDSNFKVVITLHDYFIACPNGGFYNYRKNEICKLTPLSKECIFCNCDSRKYAHKVWRVLRQWTQRYKGLVPNGVKNYIYISELSRKVIEPYLPKGSNLYYVKNPVDIEKEQPVKVWENTAFLYIGRLSKEKGCILFAEAAKELGIEANFIGDGELKQEIKRVYPKVNLTGWLSKEEIKQELKKARTLVFPSLLYETLGLTALEAQAKGVPVIVSDTCTAREIVKDQYSGLWFKRNDKEDLKQKIKMLMNDDIVRNYGKNAYDNYWENDYSLGNHVNELEKVYGDILERGKK